MVIIVVVVMAANHLVIVGPLQRFKNRSIFSTNIRSSANVAPLVFLLINRLNVDFPIKLKQLLCFWVSF